jgi:ABC-2 type transport system permease protein
MKTKELLEARWKLISFVLLALLVAGVNVASYQFVKGPMPGVSTGGSVPPSIQNLLQERLASFNAFAWGGWFQLNGPFILALGAAILGCGLIAGEVSKGTIFFLLSKPVSRERILLTKYGVSMGILFAVTLTASITIEGVGIALGHPQEVLRLLVATVLLWLGALFPLGLSLFFSVVFPDIVRPLAFALVITVVLSLSAIFPNGQDWSLLRYWSSSDAYLGGGFPLKESLVCLVAAALPLLGALVVFRRKAY